MAARKPLVIDGSGRKALLPAGDTLQGTVATATALATGRTIGMTGDVTWTSPAFTGSANVTAVGTLANSGVTAGTYNNSATQTQSFTVDAKGRITGVGSLTTITPAWNSITSKPTTLAGYGITDAQGLDADLTAIGALADTSGLLRKTAANTWTLDSTLPLSYLPIQRTNDGKFEVYENVLAENLGISLTGTVQIMLPYGKNLTMLSVILEGYNYNSGRGYWRVEVSGYTYTSGWTSNPTKAITGNPIFGSEVRLGWDTATGNGVILLGNTSTVWNYSKVLIRRVLISYQLTLDWSTGWSITTTTDESGLNGIVNPVMTGIQGNAGTATALATERTLAITGDLTWTSPAFDGSANVTAVGTLANSGVTAGTYNNSSTQTQSFTVDAKGRITGVGSLTTITPAWNSITSKPTTLNDAGITGGSLTGDLSFGFSTRQMLNLYSTTFAIGVQNNTLYHRTNETTGGYAWFQGGIHSSTQNDPGEGGTLLAKIDSSGNILSTKGLYAHGTIFSSIVGSNFSWTSSATSGIVHGVYNIHVIDPGTSLAANTVMYGTRSSVFNKITNTQAGSYTVSLYGAYNQVQSSDTAGENRKLNTGIGSYNQATSNSIGSTAGTLYGTDSFAIVYDSSSTTTVKGLLARIQGGSTAAGGSTMTTATSVDSLITNYTASTITSAYLFKGDYANTGTITSEQTTA